MNSIPQKQSPKLHPCDLESSDLTAAFLHATLTPKQKMLAAERSFPSPTHYLKAKMAALPELILIPPSENAVHGQTMKGRKWEAETMRSESMQGEPSSSLPSTAFLAPARRPPKPPKMPPSTETSATPSPRNAVPSKELKWESDTIPSVSDRSRGDGGGRLARSRRTTRGSGELPLFDSSTIGDISGERMNVFSPSPKSKDPTRQKHAKGASSAATSASAVPAAYDDDDDVDPDDVPAAGPPEKKKKKKKKKAKATSSMTSMTVSNADADTDFVSGGDGGGSVKKSESLTDSGEKDNPTHEPTGNGTNGMTVATQISIFFRNPIRILDHKSLIELLLNPFRAIHHPPSTPAPVPGPAPVPAPVPVVPNSYVWMTKLT